MARTEERGHLSLDFLVAMGVFLVTIGVVFGSVPGMVSEASSKSAFHDQSLDRITTSIIEMIQPSGPGTAFNSTDVVRILGACENSGVTHTQITEQRTIQFAIQSESGSIISVTHQGDGYRLACPETMSRTTSSLTRLLATDEEHLVIVIQEK